MNFRAHLLLLIVACGISGSLGENEERNLRRGGSKAPPRDIPNPITVAEEEADIPFDDLDQLRMDAVDFSLPVPDDVDNRLAQGGNRSLADTTITTWYCRTNSGQKDVAVVRIWWGHNNGAADWACNNWISKCPQNGNCYSMQVTQSLWNCYKSSDLKFVGNTQIWWGHSPGDGKWACDNWVSDCVNTPGGCLVTGGMVFSNGADCNTWSTSDGCSGGVQWERDANKQACDQHDYCYHGPVVTSFRETYSWCNNLFIQIARETSGAGKAAAEIWYSGMRADPLFTSGTVAGPGFGDAFQNEQIKTERRCLLGRSLPQGYTTTPCWGSGTWCLEGTSCYNCCDGSSWSKCI